MGIKKRMQINFIKTCIKAMTKDQLEGLRGIIECYPEDEDKTIILTSVRGEYDKRGYKWDENEVE
jgi:hypothetical protein